MDKEIKESLILLGIFILSWIITSIVLTWNNKHYFWNHG